MKPLYLLLLLTTVFATQEQTFGEINESLKGLPGVDVYVHPLGEPTRSIGLKREALE